jgi:hypothetical protein
LPGKCGMAKSNVSGQRKPPGGEAARNEKADESQSLKISGRAVSAAPLC